MTYHAIYRIESGGDTYISTLERIAEALGVDFPLAYKCYCLSRKNIN